MLPITCLARHHLATTSGDVFVFETHWNSLGWHTGGYHENILCDGKVQLCFARQPLQMESRIITIIPIIFA